MKITQVGPLIEYRQNAETLFEETFPVTCLCAYCGTTFVVEGEQDLLLAYSTNYVYTQCPACGYRMAVHPDVDDDDAARVFHEVGIERTRDRRSWYERNRQGLCVLVAMIVISALVIGLTFI